MNIVPLRGLELGLSETEYPTVPFPAPALPLVMLIQPVEGVASHPHPLLVVTPTLPPPPLQGNDALLPVSE